MREKITLEQFREMINELKHPFEPEDISSINSFFAKYGIKEFIPEGVESLEEYFNSLGYEEVQKKEDEMYRVFKQIQDRIFSYDLSDIPSSEWDGVNLTISKNDTLDLSETKGHFDFKKMRISVHDRNTDDPIDLRPTIIGHNCDIKNLFSINSHPSYTRNFIIEKKNFDENTIIENEAAFNDDAPEKIKEMIKKSFYFDFFSLEELLSFNEEELEYIQNSPFFNTLFSENAGRINYKSSAYFLKDPERRKLLFDLIKTDRPLVEYLASLYSFDYEKLINNLGDSEFNKEEFEILIHDYVEQRANILLFENYGLIENIMYGREYSTYKKDDISKALKVILPSILKNIDDPVLLEKINNNSLIVEDFIKYPELLNNPILLFFSRDKELLEKIYYESEYTQDEEIATKRRIETFETFIGNCKNIKSIKERAVESNKLYEIFEHSSKFKESDLDERSMVLDPKEFDIFSYLSTDTIKAYNAYYASGDDYFKNFHRNCCYHWNFEEGKMTDEFAISLLNFLKRTYKPEEVNNPIFLSNNIGLDRLLFVEVFKAEDPKEFLDTKADKIIEVLNKFRDIPIPGLSSIIVKFCVKNAEADLEDKDIQEKFNFFHDSLKIKYSTPMVDLLTKFFESSIGDINSDNFIDNYKKLISVMEELKKRESTNELNSSSLLKVISFFKNSIESGNFLNIDIENKIDNLIALINRIEESNSSELKRISNEVISQLIVIEDDNEAREKLDRIEEVFLKNNLPFVAKVYKVFEALHQGMVVDNSRSRNYNETNSQLKKRTMIFSDLLRCAMGSNNKSLIEYVNNIERGNAILSSIISGAIRIEDLNKPGMEQDKEVYEIYIKHLNTLYNNTRGGRVLKGNIVKDTYELLSLFLKTEKTNFDVSKLPDRIISMFAHYAGFDTLEDFKKYMVETVRDKEAKNIELGRSGKVDIKKGDFIKGLVSIEYVEYMLQNGSLCKEFLGANASSDCTPLDTDLSKITFDVDCVGDVFTKGNLAAQGYGGPNGLYVVLRCDDRFNDTTESSTYDPTKLEAFVTGGRDHYGIRTGFASSDIDYFIALKYEPRLGLEIAKNGFYIPIVNKEGKVVFTPEMYQDMRNKMSGLSYYGEPIYKKSSNLSSSEIMQTKEIIKEDIKKTNAYNNQISSRISQALIDAGIDNVIYGFNPDLTQGTAELYATGSTARNTNVPNDSDFDYLIKVDREIFFDPLKLSELKENLKTSLGLKDGYDGKICGEIKQENGDVLDVEISFCPRTDKIELSTDSSLSQKLDAIKEQYPDNYEDILANIVYAKMLFKSVKAYKSTKSDASQGGLGGIGIENWILQHGGSLIDAARDFVSVAEEAGSFEKFKEMYQVFDLGENHYSGKKTIYPHDNFVGDNGKMSINGYEKMLEVLKAYIKTYDEENNLENSDKTL